MPVVEPEHPLGRLPLPPAHGDRPVLNLGDEERLDQAIEQFSRLVEGIQSRQSRLEHRVGGMLESGVSAGTDRG